MTVVTTPNPGLKKKRIAILTMNELRFFVIRLAEELKREHACEVHLYCHFPEQLRYYEQRSADGVFDSISLAYFLDDPKAAEGADIEALKAEASRLEDVAGVGYGYLSVNHRSFGRGYWLGGFGQPRTRQSITMTYRDMLAYYNSELGFWEREFQDKGFDLAIGNKVTFVVMAQAMGCAVRAWQISRHKNFAYWAKDEFLVNPEIEEAFALEPELPGDREAQVVEPYAFDIGFRDRYLKQISAWNTGRKVVREIARRLYWRLRGYRKGVTYLIRDQVRAIVKVRTDTKRMCGPETCRLSDFGSQKAVFFPLQTEPENSLQQQSPEFMSQLSAICALARDMPADTLLARDMPADTLLAVKEAPHAVGRRPDQFYDQILAHKNVVMLNMLEKGIACCQRADVVATINGTPGLEASLMGKPVLLFGDHAPYHFLPTVKRVDCGLSLRDALHATLDAPPNPDEGRAAGRRYLRAMEKTSFDMRDYDFVNFETVADETVKDAVTMLERSITHEGEPRDRAEAPRSPDLELARKG